MTIKTSITHWTYWLGLMIIGVLCLPACEEFFSPELDDFQPILVVDGSITNLPGPYTVKLTFSSGVFSDDQQAVEGAVVSIVEQGGQEERLTETQPGYYVTSDNGIQGIPGKSYKVQIQLQDGTQYESGYQELSAPIAIDSVGVNLEYQYLSIERPDVPGYQFYITTQQAENEENYLMWALEATFKYRADFTIDYLYSNRRIEAYPNPTEFKTCWRTDQVNEIFTFNTATLSEPRIERLPLHFVDAYSRELSIRYSLLVKQFTIGQEAHAYWDNLRRQIESQETLYNTQPFQVRGNLSNVNNSDETVLGFFMAAGLSEKRIFVNHPQEINREFSYCDPDYAGYGLIGLIHPSQWPIFVYEDETGRRALGNDECFDCRELGGTIFEPEFWED